MQQRRAPKTISKPVSNPRQLTLHEKVQRTKNLRSMFGGMVQRNKELEAQKRATPTPQQPFVLREGNGRPPIQGTYTPESITPQSFAPQQEIRSTYGLNVQQSPMQQ